MEQSSIQRKVAYGLTSFLVGVCIFITWNETCGPTFEPILAACQNSEIPVEDFASTTGYHAYDRRVGLKVFDFLVCFMTQFFLELRQAHPAGLLVWGGVVVVAFVMLCITTIESGRAGARGPIRYPTIIGLLSQPFGFCVIFPLVVVPGVVFGEGKRGSPVTSFRTVYLMFSTLPLIALTTTVFVAPTESQLWTTAAGMLGGPILPMFGLALFHDASSELAATKESAKASSVAVTKAYKLIMVPGLIGWYTLVAIFYQSYGTSLSDLWDDIWVNAGASVAFMTIDTGGLYLGVLMYIAYRYGESKAAKALFLTLVLGPAGAALYVMIEAENEMDFAYLDDEKKKD